MTEDRCIWPSCTKRPEPSVCAEHWKVLPSPIRDELIRARRGGNGEQTLGLRRAVLSAQAWIQATFAGGDGGGRRRANWDALVASVRARDAARRAQRGQPVLELATKESTEPERADAQRDLFEGMETR